MDAEYDGHLRHAYIDAGHGHVITDEGVTDGIHLRITPVDEDRRLVIMLDPEDVRRVLGQIMDSATCTGGRYREAVEAAIRSRNARYN